MKRAAYSPDKTLPKSWQPRTVLVTRSAREFTHGRVIVERAARMGAEVVELSGDRLKLNLPEDPKQAYAQAKATLGVVVAPPSKRKLQPIAPSADWRVDLAQGCPAHCGYCYLAGSLKGPPITRAYANLDEIFGALPDYLGKGTITSKKAARQDEGTTYEASCYTDPLGIEAVTGSLSAAISWFGNWDASAQLRFTTKFDDVDSLLDLDHNGRTRMRASINPAAFARFEGGTAPVSNRLVALSRMAQAGYPIGLTIAPIIAVPGWERAYAELIDQAGHILGNAANADLTIELITHRYTAGSKETLESWYPGSKLDMSDANRAPKRNKFGGEKQVYDAATMKTLKAFFHENIAAKLPHARILYWT
ncbi:MAG: spore photoproduct lyase family protein [Pontixanthobacter sp.]